MKILKGIFNNSTRTSSQVNVREVFFKKTSDLLCEKNFIN